MVYVCLEIVIKLANLSGGTTQTRDCHKIGQPVWWHDTMVYCMRGCLKCMVWEHTFLHDDTFVCDNTVAYVGFTCIQTYMNACYMYCWQSVREMSNKKDKYAITVYKSEGVVGHILCIILSRLT